MSGASFRHAVDPATLYWLRGHLAEHLASGRANGTTPKAERALTMVREMCDLYQDSPAEQVCVRVMISEKEEARFDA